MCGIAALFTDSPDPDLPTWLAAMMARVRHRGPDGEGMQCGTRQGLQIDRPPRTESPADWGLGHVRLAILDLSTAGLQPMSTADRRLWISYNGEVYNYVELTAELRAAGHLFRTGTDTEVILAAYRQWGPDCVARFRGMFAFVLVDLDAAQVFVARDRLGIKPLYLWTRPGLTAVVSELKQLYPLPGFVPRLNHQQAVDYLCEGLLGHEPEQTMLEDVIPFEPGCWLNWRLGDAPALERRRTFWLPSRRHALPALVGRRAGNRGHVRRSGWAAVTVGCPGRHVSLGRHRFVQYRRGCVTGLWGPDEDLFRLPR